MSWLVRVRAAGMDSAPELGVYTPPGGNEEGRQSGRRQIDIEREEEHVMAGRGEASAALDEAQEVNRRLARVLDR